MNRKRILFSWIGDTDFRGLAPSLSQKDRDRLGEEIPRLDDTPNGGGPIRTLLDKENFDEIHLISNRSGKINRLFGNWIGGNVRLHDVEVQDVSEYSEIFKATDSCIKTVYDKLASKETADFHFFLSPGTPTMTAVLVLLGKSRYPATFWQTHRGNARISEIPFDLSVDFLPEILKDADSAFHHLASRSPQEIEGFEQIIGSSAAIRHAVGRAQRTSLRDISVLLLGESGTGKELFAWAIHNASRRKGKPFITLNCAAFPESLIESELFGHDEGAFTGAKGKKDGAFKLADGGTLFLDEIGECPQVQQAKLLRVLQPPPGTSPCCREFTPVGGSKPIRCDVRVVAATNRDLPREITEGRFREDLYYRLAMILVKLPPLRDRREDIISIAESILDRINEDFKKHEKGYEHKKLSKSTKIFVKNFAWPGNVRQLNNALLQAAVLSDGSTIQKHEIEEAVAETGLSSRISDFPSIPLGNGFSLDGLLTDIRIKYLKKAMQEAGGNMSKASQLIGYGNYQTLAHQLKTLNVEWNDAE